MSTVRIRPLKRHENAQVRNMVIWILSKQVFKEAIRYHIFSRYTVILIPLFACCLWFSKFSTNVILAFPMIITILYYIFVLSMLLLLWYSEIWSEIQDFHRHYNSGPRKGFWVAEVDGRIVGSVSVDFVTEDRAELKRMAVDPNVQRQGIASKLVKHAIEFARKEKYKELFLSTSMFQMPAQCLYRKCGFQLAETIQYMTGYTFPFPFFYVTSFTFRLDLNSS